MRASVLAQGGLCVCKSCYGLYGLRHSWGFGAVCRCPMDALRSLYLHAKLGKHCPHVVTTGSLPNLEKFAFASTAATIQVPTATTV